MKMTVLIATLAIFAQLSAQDAERLNFLFEAGNSSAYEGIVFLEVPL